MPAMTITKVDIRHRISSLQKIVFQNLDLSFREEKLIEMLISRKWWKQARTKLSVIFYRFFYIPSNCGCCAPSIWPSFSRSNVFFLWYICNRNCALTVDARGRFASSRTVSAVEWLSFNIGQRQRFSAVDVIYSVFQMSRRWLQLHTIYAVTYFQLNKHFICQY